MQLTIGLIAAMRSELEPFLALGLGGEANEILLGRPVYTRRAAYGDEQGSVDVTLVLMVGGIGKVRAASATQALIDRHHPDLILNIGTAGALRPEIEIGDIVVTTRQYQHDSGLWERFACTSDQRLSALLCSELSKNHRVHRGNGCAGDIFQAELAGKLQLAERFAASCVDMESAAIADTCAVNRVPFCIIRSISDGLEGDADEFERNYQQVSQLVAKAVAPLVGKLALQLRQCQETAELAVEEQTRHRFTDLATPRLLLRRFRASDALPLWRYRSDLAACPSRGDYTLAQAEALVREQAAFAAGFAGTWFRLAIALRETGELIGDIGIHTLAHDSSQVELGFTLARQHQGQGLAQEAVTAVANYLFTELDVHRIVACVDTANHPAAALLKRLGFRQEGHQRQSTWSKGEWRDDLQFALLREEWPAQTCRADSAGENQGVGRND